MKEKLTEEELYKKAHALGERVKELNCFYGLSKLVENSDATLESIFQGLIELIPPAWQYPELTCARIIFEKKEYITKRFHETQWSQFADIFLHEKKVGKMEVYYLEERPVSDEGLFLKEERALIDALTERLGRIIEHVQAEEELKAANQQLRASDQQLRASDQQLRASDQQLKSANLTLGERVKELNCLYGLSKLVEKSDATLESIFQGLIQLIPPSWQYPEVTCVRIIFGDKEYKTENFKETIWKQESPILFDCVRFGNMEVFYLEKKPEEDEGPFLKEERKLINVITENLGRIIERIRMEEENERVYSKMETLLAQKLSEYLPICAKCKRIRDKDNNWNQIEDYIEEKTKTKFSHGICPECKEEYYSDLS
ncbi:MAG: hypothetical protein KAI43_07415 [Candidatus Aureabacteria bacterium]|nr:hypothetical protein [Candidatus Auribacterota bacterium]